MWGITRFLWATDRPQLFLGDELRQQAFQAGYACLQAYSSRCTHNIQVKRINYKLRPKWRRGFCCVYIVKAGRIIALRHAFSHIVHSYATGSDENVRNHKTLAEEDCLGKITTLAGAVHGATVVRRFFERFTLFMSMHWAKLKCLKPSEIQEPQ